VVVLEGGNEEEGQGRSGLVSLGVGEKQMESIQKRGQRGAKLGSQTEGESLFLFRGGGMFRAIVGLVEMEEEDQGVELK